MADRRAGATPIVDYNRPNQDGRGEPSAIPVSSTAVNTRSAAVSVNGVRRIGGRADANAVDIQLLNASVGYMLRRAQLAVFADFGETLAELGLRPAQFAVLTVLDHNPGVTQSEVCTALSIQHANFVSIIDGLEGRGLAKRTSSATDRRSKSLSLTTAGRRVLERASELQRVHESRIGIVSDRAGAISCCACSSGWRTSTTATAQDMR